MTRQHWWAAVAVLACAVGVAAALVWARDDDAGPAAASTTTTTVVTTTTTSSTSTSDSTTSTSTSTTVPADPIPDPVSAVSSYAGAGSGEVALEWGTVAGTTGYRVVRSDAAGSVLDVIAEIDVRTGHATATDQVANIWTDQHAYIPGGAALTTPDTSAQIRLIDVGGPGSRCYRVVAFSTGGDAAPSPVACGSPP